MNSTPIVDTGFLVALLTLTNSTSPTSNIEEKDFFADTRDRTPTPVNS
jgi:hypothetical protein